VQRGERRLHEPGDASRQRARRAPIAQRVEGALGERGERRAGGVAGGVAGVGRAQPVPEPPLPARGVGLRRLAGERDGRRVPAARALRRGHRVAPEAVGDAAREGDGARAARRRRVVAGGEVGAERRGARRGVGIGEQRGERVEHAPLQAPRRPGAHVVGAQAEGELDGRLEQRRRREEAHVRAHAERRGEVRRQPPLGGAPARHHPLGGPRVGARGGVPQVVGQGVGEGHRVGAANETEHRGAV
jgi:hypothetical protein